MFSLGEFENKLAELKNEHCHNSYVYPDQSNPFKTFCDCTQQHFGEKNKGKYGIYVVRKNSPPQKVLYIGKGGTINNSGDFKTQDIPGRLTAERSKILANDWFKNLHEECNDNLLIEYTILPKNGFPSPALVEAILLQAYFDDKRHLPLKNKEF